MATRTGAVLKRIVETVAKANADGDRELLRRFVKDSDQAAFTALVERHTPMVFGICRRGLPTVQDAEDACQAVFVILARKAKSEHWQASIANWLYTTARRVAHNARVAAQRRAKREGKVRIRAIVEPLDRMTGRDLLAMLDEELDKLPPRYREPLVLCYLQGLTRDEAAARLEVPAGTLKIQLERGRKRLGDALTKRGSAFGAGLLALAATSAAGAPPPRLVEAVAAAAAGSPSAAVAALAKGAAVNGYLNKSMLAVLALVGLAALGLGLGSVNPTAAGPLPRNDTPKVATPPDAAKAIEVSGRVLDADRKPIGGADVTCMAAWKKDAGVTARVTTGNDGRFHLTLTRKDLMEVVTVTATAAGYAADWVVPPDTGNAVELTLQLTKDDFPFTGRIATLESQGLKGVTVEVVRIGKVREGDLTGWIDKNMAMRKESYWLNENGLLTVPGRLMLANVKTTTDAAGKFKLTGFGRDRVLTVKVYGPNVETKFFWIVTRPGGSKDGYIKTRDFNHGLYPPEVTVLLLPSRPLVGTVRDSKTGKPVAGVIVSEVNAHIPTAITDADGKYRLEGVPKKSHYGLNVAGRKGLPYFDHTHPWEPDIAGLDPLETNLMVDRGLELTGRVIDKATGKPVMADIHYMPVDDNPNAKKSLPTVFSSDGWKTKPDGTFYLTVWPGKGVLSVHAHDGDRYVRVDVEKILSQMNIRSRVSRANALFPIDVDDAKPESLTVAIALEEGVVRKGTIVGPDGKPLAGVTAAGISSDDPPGPLKSHEFTVSGMAEHTQRMLLFIHDGKKLGALQPITGSGNDPLTIKLQPLGSATGEVRMADDGPLTRATVTAVPFFPDAKKYENLPSEAMKFQGTFSAMRSLWWKLTKRTAKTDDNGRFRLDGLMPGLEYTFYVSDGDLGESGTLVTSRQKVTVPSGKTHDLGILKKGDYKK